MLCMYVCVYVNISSILLCVRKCRRNNERHPHVNRRWKQNCVCSKIVSFFCEMHSTENALEVYPYPEGCLNMFTDHRPVSWGVCNHQNFRVVLDNLKTSQSMKRLSGSRFTLFIPFLRWLTVHLSQLSVPFLSVLSQVRHHHPALLSYREEFIYLDISTYMYVYCLVCDSDVPRQHVYI